MLSPVRLLPSLPRRSSLPVRKCSSAALQLSSSIVGESGRVYTRGELLRRHPTDDALSVFKAECGAHSFIAKRVNRQFLQFSQRFALDFPNSKRLRMHTDYNEEEGVLIFPYFNDTLLSLMQKDPDFSPEGRMKLLRQVGEAIQELHGKDWVHVDIKPDNVLVNWDGDVDEQQNVTAVALGDFDLAFKYEHARPLNTPYAIGNAMWRSPEGQTGRGVTKASDIYSFALMCIYALGGDEFLLLHGYQELLNRGISPEQEILTRHFGYFGPVPEALFHYIGDEKWANALLGASQIADEMVKENPGLRFASWASELGPDAVQILSKMTALDPNARPGIDEVLQHPFWNGSLVCELAHAEARV